MRFVVPVAVAVGAAVAGAVVLATSDGAAWPPRGGGALAGVVEVSAPDPPDGSPGSGEAAAGGADGAPAGGLQPGVVAALDRARRAAAGDGVALSVTSGYRTVAEQEALLAEAVEEHGSRAAAERWVFPPDRSMHVRGLAVDIGGRRAAEWLDRHGAPFGLCRTLAWEWWHFEWRARWEAAGRCPVPVDDPVDAPPA